MNIDVFQELKSARNRAEESEGEEKEKEKEKEYNQEHTRSNAQYQDHELRRGATRYAHAQAHSTDCKLRQSITLEGANGIGERNSEITRTTQGPWICFSPLPPPSLPLPGNSSPTDHRINLLQRRGCGMRVAK